MGIAGAIALFVIGTAFVVGTLWSAMLTVVVPRAERPRISRVHFALIRNCAWGLCSLVRDPLRRDRISARIAPLALITLPFAWAVLIIAGFAMLFRAISADSFRDAVVLSGSSLTTLGYRSAEDLPTLVLTILEALIGLGLIGLMISYLPSIYSAYTDREVAVARLEVRADRPPNPYTFLDRSHRIGWLEQMDAVWSEWETWFLRIEETHTTHEWLPFFRSAVYGRSWLTAAGTVLDSAAIITSAVDLEFSPRAVLCIRSGFTTLRSIAEVYALPFDPDPRPDDPISITKTRFFALLDDLGASGLPIKADREQAWRDFAGWRVNYDAPLGELMGHLRVDHHDWFAAPHHTDQS